jgi:probable HAF family extracellular repeat protein
MSVTVKGWAQCAVLGSLAMASVVALANSYKVVDLGPHPNVIAINNDGVVVDQMIRGKIYRNGRWHNLPAHSDAKGINLGSDVVGDNGKTLLPILWPKGGAPVELGLPAGGVVGYAVGINDDRMVVGWYENSARAPRCFMWTADSGSVDLGLMKEGTQCEAYGVNKVGQVTGYANVTDSPFFSRAFIWQDGVFTDLGTLRGQDSSFGFAINDLGHVVGTTSTNAFLWTDRMIDLDPQNQFVSSVAMSINTIDEIVGYAQRGIENIAVRFADGRVIDLLSEVPDTQKWTALTRAVSINDQGIIVGFGTRFGDDHAFMLIPRDAAEARH